MARNGNSSNLKWLSFFSDILEQYQLTNGLSELFASDLSTDVIRFVVADEGLLLASENLLLTTAVAIKP